MNDINLLMKRLSKPLFIFTSYFCVLYLEEPVGSYEGSIKDWAMSILGTIMANGKF